MGVKTKIFLEELNKLFSSYNFIELTPTSSGIMDTTYIVHTKTTGYILKKYERDISTKIDRDIKLLSELKSAELNVPICLDNNDDWYLYEKLQGREPKHIKTYHIQALARFLASLHQLSYSKKCSTEFIDKNQIISILNYIKLNFYAYYKKLDSLKNYNSKNDGFIHGDIFKDNTVFDGLKVGVFDFIDSGCGNFTFDVAVALVAFDAKKHKPYFLNLFLNTYNQHAPKKLNKRELLKEMEAASKFYALLRIDKYKNTKKTKELL